jgi:Domain of unknown function (DUF4278)
MYLSYRGIRYEDPLLKLQLETPDKIVGQAIFRLKYRGICYWICRYKTRSGFAFNKKLTPVNSCKN